MRIHAHCRLASRQLSSCATNIVDLMTAPRSLTLAFLLTAGFASDAGAADRQWARRVEKLFGRKRSSITTPLEHRAQLARSIAEKLGRKCEVVRVETGFKVTVTG